MYQLVLTLWLHTTYTSSYYISTQVLRTQYKLLLTLEQGLRSLEDYIQEYLDLAHFSDLPDCVLIDFFCEGINQPLKSHLIREDPRSSLSQFMDYALLTVGPVF